jgi:hypothetical protein
MKKVICIVAMLALCLSLVCPAFASEDTFVPSIGYKDGPEIIAVEEEFDIHHLVVTSIKDAQDKTTDVLQEDRDLLLSVYEQLESGAMELPLSGEKGDYVIRDLVHVGFTVDCRESGDGHEEKLDQKNATLAVTFRLGIDANTNVLLMSYLHGQWKLVEKVVNHGDGTLSCELEDVGPVAFVVCDPAVEPLPGEQEGRNCMWWLLLLLICIAVLTRMLLKRLKRSRK